MHNMHTCSVEESETGLAGPVPEWTFIAIEMFKFAIRTLHFNVKRENVPNQQPKHNTFRNGMFYTPKVYESTP